jgi:hypothetical protein
MFLAGTLSPHDVVEEQGLDVGGSQPGELEARSMDDHLAERSDL